MRAARARSPRLCTYVAIGLVAVLYAVVCLLALLAEPQRPAPQSEPPRLDVE